MFTVAAAAITPQLKNKAPQQILPKPITNIMTQTTLKPQPTQPSPQTGTLVLNQVSNGTTGLTPILTPPEVGPARTGLRALMSLGISVSKKPEFYRWLTEFLVQKLSQKEKQHLVSSAFQRAQILSMGYRIFNRNSLKKEKKRSFIP